MVDVVLVYSLRNLVELFSFRTRLVPLLGKEADALLLSSMMFPVVPNFLIVLVCIGLWTSSFLHWPRPYAVPLWPT